jgi:hypothetical protein
VVPETTEKDTVMHCAFLAPVVLSSQRKSHSCGGMSRIYTIAKLPTRVELNKVNLWRLLALYKQKNKKDILSAWITNSSKR